MKEGQARGRVTAPRSYAVVPAKTAQYGQAQGDHVTEQGSTGYGGVKRVAGRGYEPPPGPSVKSGVGGGRNMYPGGSQGRR